MNKLNRFIYVLTLIMLPVCFIGCSPSSYHPLSWIDSNENASGAHRLPASDSVACFIDRFDIEQIKKENSELEKEWKKAERVSAKFDFAKFKPAETHYIKLFEKYITLNELARKCSDLPCVLSSAYGKPDGEEGHRIYNWFLTMGSGISTAREIPSYATDETKDLKSYLFPNEELKILNIASKAISTKYRKILVSTLHRFPDGTSPGPMVAGQYNPYWYYYGPRDNPTSVDKQPSAIFLTKQDFRLDQRDLLIRGHYYHTLIHELTHALDFSNGPSKSRKDFSDLDPWALLSWKWAEVTRLETQVVDGKEREVEITEMKWQIDPEKKDGFLRSYQRTSPAEDFADSGAHYIIDPEGLEKVSPNKYKVFKEKFYFDIGMTKNDFVNKQSEIIALKLESEVWEIVKDCLVDKKNLNNLDSQKVKLDTPSYLEASAKKCLEASFYNIISNDIKNLKLENYHACNYLQSTEMQLYEQIIAKLHRPLHDSIAKVDEYKVHQANWIEFRANLKNNCDPIHIFLAAQQSSRPQDKFFETLTSCVEKQYQVYANLGEIIREEKEHYIKAHDYNLASIETTQTFNQLMRGFETQLLKAARSLLNNCSVVKDEVLIGKGPIHGANVYVNASVLNCLNASFSLALDEELKGFLAQKYAWNQDVIYYLSKQYQTSFVEFIHREISQINMTEQKKYLPIFKTIAGQLESQFINNQAWHKKLLENDNSVTYCQQNLKDIAFEIIEKNWQIAGYPLTLSLHETRNLVIDDVCPKLIAQAQINMQMELYKVEKEILEVVKSLTQEKHNWVSLIDHEQNFNIACQEGLAQKAGQQGIKIFAKSASIFLSESKIANEILTQACQTLTKDFSSQLEDIKKESTDFEVAITNFLIKDLNWQISYTESDYIKNCQLHVQTNYPPIKNSLSSTKNWSLVPDQLQVKFLALSSCKKHFLKWVKYDLEILVKAAQQKTLSYKTFIQSQKQSLAWQNYMINFNDQIVQHVSDHLLAKFETTRASCFEKYPYVRFATMKLNRKKCLQQFFEQNNSDALLPVSNLDKVDVPVLLKYLSLSLNNEYHKLENNLDVYLR